MHCYSTYFFQMLIGLEVLPRYNYSVVQNWSSNIDGVSSVLDLRKLYIPINKGHCTRYSSGSDQRTNQSNCGTPVATTKLMRCSCN